MTGLSWLWLGLVAVLCVALIMIIISNRRHL
jgi:hypothetical protein